MTKRTTENLRELGGSVVNLHETAEVLILKTNVQVQL